MKPNDILEAMEGIPEKYITELIPAQAGCERRMWKEEKICPDNV